MPIGIDFECVGCGHKSIYPYPEFRQFDILYCQNCDLFCIILDSFTTFPGDVMSSGLTKQIGLEPASVEKLFNAGLIWLQRSVNARFNYVGRVFSPYLQRVLIEKYNSDEPRGPIEI